MQYDIPKWLVVVDKSADAIGSFSGMQFQRPNGRSLPTSADLRRPACAANDRSGLRAICR